MLEPIDDHITPPERSADTYTCTCTCTATSASKTQEPVTDDKMSDFLGDYYETGSGVC
jgi:hypothetical protein